MNFEILAVWARGSSVQVCRSCFRDEIIFVVGIIQNKTAFWDMVSQTDGPSRRIPDRPQKSYTSHLFASCTFFLRRVGDFLVVSLSTDSTDRAGSLESWLVKKIACVVRISRLSFDLVKKCDAIFLRCVFTCCHNFEGFNEHRVVQLF